MLVNQSLPGQGNLIVEQVEGQSTAVSVLSTAPFRWLVPRHRGLCVWAFGSSLGGGLVAGDETVVALEIRPETHCFVGTQSATKVYRNPSRLACGQSVRARVGARALLALLPDAVQLFAGSRYRQRQVFELDPDANLVLLDSISGGRSACGERWAFDSFDSRNEIRVDGKRRFLDAIRLDPEDGEIGASHRMGRFNCLAMLVLWGPRLAAAANLLVREVARRPAARRSSMIFSASPLADGAVVRVAAERIDTALAEIHSHLPFLSCLLGDDPFARKW